jgi:hypothetical protein
LRAEATSDRLVVDDQDMPVRVVGLDGVGEVFDPSVSGEGQPRLQVDQNRLMSFLAEAPRDVVAATEYLCSSVRLLQYERVHRDDRDRRRVVDVLEHHSVGRYRMKSASMLLKMG